MNMIIGVDNAKTSSEASSLPGPWKDPECAEERRQYVDHMVEYSATSV